MTHVPRYYTGRLAAYDEDFAKADAHLSFAYRLCHKDAKANQRRILKFLVPVSQLGFFVFSFAFSKKLELQPNVKLVEAKYIVCADVLAS